MLRQVYQPAGAVFIIGFSRLRTLEFFVFRKMEMSETKNHPLMRVEANNVIQKITFPLE